MTTIDKARDLLERRRNELTTELSQIDAALASLGSVTSGARGSPRRGRVTRAPRGQRRREILGYLETNSNSKPSAIAEALGMAPSQVSTLIRTLRNEKLVRKTRGGGYSLSSAPPSASGSDADSTSG